MSCMQLNQSVSHLSIFADHTTNGRLVRDVETWSEWNCNDIFDTVYQLQMFNAWYPTDKANTDTKTTAESCDNNSILLHSTQCRGHIYTWSSNAAFAGGNQLVSSRLAGVFLVQGCMSDLYHQAPHSHVSLHHSPPPVSIWTSAQTHTHNRVTALCPGLAGWAGTRKVKPVWILLKQETMLSGSGISLAVCKSTHRSRQISTPPLSFLQVRCYSCCPTNSVEAQTYN